MLLRCLREATAKQGAESFAKGYGRAPSSKPFACAEASAKEHDADARRKLQRKRKFDLQIGT
ncbi:MAG: hypothetical protein DHS20C18_48030 [Saprospiraceae bacterium]|nr:MAG: hypothetical protein DHS20C18_48030 [Saprospiraceae bacterium]